MKRFLIPVFFVALGSVAAYSVTQGPKAYAALKKEHKVAICHGTASAKHPYVLIIVDESARAAHLAGHGRNSAPDFILNNGKILTPKEEAYYHSLDDNQACGTSNES